MSAGQKKYRKGIFNNYRGNMPYTEIITKDLAVSFDTFLHLISRGKTRPVIVATPDLPGKRTTLHKIAKLLGYRLTNKPLEKAALIIQFDDQTFSTTEIPSKLAGKKMVNENCRDISKQKVDKVHLEVFGYNTIIDPLIYQGIAVMKSDENARHDGQKIECPVKAKEDGVVYQILIDNEVDDRFVVDYRVPVMKSNIPLVYKKYKTHDVRFTNEVHHSTLHKSDEFLSEEERNQIARFCEGMGADFCELDILRHQGDGRIYIIDLNKTPFGPPAGLSEEDKKKAVEVLAEEFKRTVMG
jgi:hypothetical protein